MKKIVNIPLKLTMADGLFVIDARVRKNNPVMSLLITDFNEECRVFLDGASKTLIANEFDVKINEAGITSILETVKKKLEEKANGNKAKKKKQDTGLKPNPA
jgi:hypothetical protein